MASECLPKLHRLVMVYSRPWKRLFRKDWTLRCWHCDFVLPLPRLRARGWHRAAPVRPGSGIMSPPGKS